MREIAPLTIAALRVIFGAVVLTVLARLVAEDPRPSRRDRVVVAGLALLGIVGNQTLYILGLARTTAVNATLIISTVPIFTLLLSWAVGRERPSWRRALGVPVALAGILFLLNPADLHLGDRTLAGDLLIAANALCYAGFLVGSRGILQRMSPLGFTASIFRWGLVPIVLLAVPDLLRFDPRSLSRATWWAMADLFVLATAVAYALNSWALARTDAATAAIFVYVQPLVAGALAFAFLHERPGPRTAVATVLIFAGVALTIVRAGPAREA